MGEVERGKNGLEGAHRSFWLESGLTAEYPRLDHALHVDVAVIGGGITGITTALLLKEAGFSVALLEADRLVHGVSGHTTAKITALQSLPYRHIMEKFGEEKAKQYAEANMAGLEKIAELVRGYSIDCDFVRKPYTVLGIGDEARRELEAGTKAAERAGLRPSYQDSVVFPFEAKGGVKIERQAQFNPVRYLRALAARIPDEKSRIFERTCVMEIAEGEIFQVATPEGSVNAHSVVVATHFPIHGRAGFYFARQHAERHYVAAVKTSTQFPDGMFLSIGREQHSYRTAPSDEGDMLILGGGHHKTGQGGDTAGYYRQLEEYVKSSLKDPSLRYRWSTQDNMTVDGVPYIGHLYSRSSRLFTATGFGSWGMTTGTAAAMILSDMIGGRENPWAPVFDPQRFAPGASAKEFLRQNLNVGKEFVKGLVSLHREKVSEIAADEADVVTHDGKKIGVYRDPSGTLHAVQGSCTHMGCVVNWNPAEKSWDCPCHGSRFSHEGKVLHAPAVEELGEVDLHA